MDKLSVLGIRNHRDKAMDYSLSDDLVIKNTLSKITFRFIPYQNGNALRITEIGPRLNQRESSMIYITKPLQTGLLNGFW